MDYGYQLLRHVIAQVFGNLAQAARITVLPMVLAYTLCAAILYLIAGPIFFEIMTQEPVFPGQPQPDPFTSDQEAIAFGMRFFGAFLICIPVFLIFYSWAAVGWHRYVLLEEMPAGVAGRWSWPIIRGYIWAVLRITFMLIPIMFGVSIVIGILLAITQSAAIAVFLTIAVSIFATWIVTRIGLVLPSASLGTYMTMGESWSETGPVSSAILLPIIVVPLAFFIITTLTGMLGVIGVILYMLLTWVQVLMNLALMTTLYGNLIEGRQLN